jgi:hypothetical protein
VFARFSSLAFVGCLLHNLVARARALSLSLSLSLPLSPSLSLYICIYIYIILYIYTWAQAVIGDLVDNLVILPKTSTYCHLLTTRRVEDKRLGHSLVHKHTIHELDADLHLRRALTRPAQTHIISGTQLLRCQYVYFCTSKASTFVLVKQVYLSAGQL